VTRSDRDRQPLYRPGRLPSRPSEPLDLVLLGATGSIGTQTVELLERHPDRFRVVGLSAGRRVDVLIALAERLEFAGVLADPVVAVADEAAHRLAARDDRLSRRLAPPGGEGLRLLAALPEARCVVNGLVGAVGLEPTLAAARAGHRVALANKESLVIGGSLVADAVRTGGGEIIPVDSEHSALAQCLVGRETAEVESLVLTASGGPFRDMSSEDMARVTRDQVLRHPTWVMGPKITVDSATLMNKGLEVIEAHVLFGLPYARLDVVVHPGSIVHSLAVFRDGAVMAQLGAPDMRVPLLYALAGERHIDLETERLDLAALGRLDFAAPDPVRFPCLALARAAGEAGGTATITLNAANEEAVAALLDDRLPYVDIAVVIEGTLSALPAGPVADLESALDADREARRVAGRLIAERAGG